MNIFLGGNFTIDGNTMMRHYLLACATVNKEQTTLAVLRIRE